jgi:hypothetical protein
MTSTRTRIFSTALAIATAAVALSACGSSSSGGSGGPLKKADLVAKANSICQTAQTAAKNVKPPTNVQDASAAAGYFDKIEPITSKETSDLSALKPDSSVASDWNAFIGAQKEASSLLSTLRSKADAKDASGLTDLAKLPAAAQKVVTSANKLGLTTCSQ